MSDKPSTPRIRILPEDVANKIAAGEVVERPASVVKELVENALDAGATRLEVRVVAAGRRTIEVTDNGHGMSEQDALLAIERHATSKVRKAADLDNIATLGFRGEALASIAAVSRFELVTRRAKDDWATRVRIDGGVLRDVSQVAAPVGTRVSAHRLYFNTPVRAKFLKGVTTELSHAIDIVQRHALAQSRTGFRFLHNDKPLLDVPQNAKLRERVALIWGLNFLRDMVDVEGEQAGLKVHGLMGAPGLTRSQRSHQFFFLNRRPVVNRSLQYGFEEGYRGLLTVGRHPVGILLFEVNPRLTDINIHPTKREARFRDERAARDAVRDIVRDGLSTLEARAQPASVAPSPEAPGVQDETETSGPHADPAVLALGTIKLEREQDASETPESPPVEQTEFVGSASENVAGVEPIAVYEPLDAVADAPLQVFDTYLVVPEGERLLIIDQHALHERLTYDNLCAELADNEYEAQQLLAPLLVDVPPSYAKLLEANLELFSKIGIEIESFGGNTFQVTSVCHLYEDSQVADAVYRVLDEVAQGDLFDRRDFVAALLRLTVEACRSSVKAGDRLSPEERRGLIEGFRRLRPPYTCPHGRPIVTELTLTQMEKSFRRKQ